MSKPSLKETVAGLGPMATIGQLQTAVERWWNETHFDHFIDSWDVLPEDIQRDAYAEFAQVLVAENARLRGLRPACNWCGTTEPGPHACRGRRP